MTDKELKLRQKVVSVAESYIGAKESDGSHKPIIDIYNRIKPLPSNYKMKYTDPWCATFVSAVSSICGLLSIMPAECSCDRMINLYKKLGRWIENDAYSPEIGDVIFYDWQDNGVGDNTGSSDHVGIVTKKSGVILTIIEGNCNDSVTTRKIAVNGKYIRGYGVPNYSGVNANMSDEIMVGDTQSGDDVTIEPIPTYSVVCTELSYGMGIGNPDEKVRAAQLLLNGRGYSCGTADGEFGKKTETAVKKYQKAKKLTSDGIIGKKTMESLLGLK